MLHDPKRQAEIEFQVKVANEPWRKALLDAADLLRRDGWCTVDFKRSDGRRCALGAIYEGLRGAYATPDATAAINKLRDYVDRTLAPSGTKYCSIALWNDDPGNSAENVIAVMERLARE